MIKVKAFVLLIKTIAPQHRFTPGISSNSLLLKKRHQDLLFKHRRIKQHQASSLIKIACHSFQSSFFF
jgi:hypothetical protein